MVITDNNLIEKTCTEINVIDIEQKIEFYMIS